MHQDLIEEYLFAFFFLFCLPAFQYTILVGPDEGYLAAFAQEFVSNVQADFVAKAGVGVGEEIFAGKVVGEGVGVEDPVSVDFFKEFGFGFVVREEQPYEVVVELSGMAVDSGGDEFAVLV